MLAVKKKGTNVHILKFGYSTVSLALLLLQIRKTRITSRPSSNKTSHLITHHHWHQATQNSCKPADGYIHAE